jgi:hypothetical protein
MESILDYVRRRLREVGSQSWEEIAKEVGSSPVTPRKIVYERDNPGVNTVEPYYRYFQRLDKAKAKKAEAAKLLVPRSAAPTASSGPIAIRDDGTVVEKEERTNKRLADLIARAPAVRDQRRERPE